MKVFSIVGLVGLVFGLISDWMFKDDDELSAISYHDTTFSVAICYWIKHNIKHMQSIKKAWNLSSF